MYQMYLMMFVLILWSCERPQSTGVQPEAENGSRNETYQTAAQDSQPLADTSSYYLIDHKIKPGDRKFNIDLVFADENFYTVKQKQTFKEAAQRWEEIILGDLPNVTFSKSGSRADTIESIGLTVAITDEVDDIRIFVTSIASQDSFWGIGGAGRIRWQNKLPIWGYLALNETKIDDVERSDSFFTLAVHEIGHCLGFGSLWNEDKFDLIRLPSEDNPGSDSHFIGSQAIQAFNRLGGLGYRGHKVPLENSLNVGSDSRDSHWRESVFGNEIMDPRSAGGHEPISGITIAALADMGYEVDLSKADEYRLPTSAKPVSVRPHGELRCKVVQPLGYVGH